jgi:Outer membrane protein beta-barrel domain
MEHLENDMDDLFQKAGELYPLKTTGSDWDAVAGKLQNEGTREVHDLTGPAAIRNRRKTWLLLLLLIPMGIGVYYFSGNMNREHQKAVSAKPLSGSVDQNKINPVIPDNHSVPATTAENIKADHNKTAASDESQSIPGKKNDSEDGSMKSTLSNINKGLVDAAGGGKQLTSNHMPDAQKQITPAGNKTKSGLNSNNDVQGSIETEAIVAGKSANTTSPSANESVPKAAATAIPPAVAIQNETAAVTKNNTDKTDSSKKTSPVSSQANKKTNTVSKKSKGFYVGLFAGPDVSTVKFQSVNKVGISVGALIGYRFNNRLSVETGVIWDKKYYYSNGEYYKKDGGAPLPPTTTLNGNCSMFEIPVDIRFDFATGKNHGFFAKAGLSSYLMTSENYTFNSNYPPYNRSFKNDTLRNNIFSILQISGGYERAISDKTKMRVEPYVKIPLQGIGRGYMPIASFGIYIGITHSFR